MWTCGVVCLFVEITAAAELLIVTANHFYTSSLGDWICIQLNPSLLSSRVIYEAPAAVGNIASNIHSPKVTFPHIYGGINVAAVTKSFPFLRDEQGRFLMIVGISE